VTFEDRIVFGRPWFDEVEEDLIRQTLRGGWIGQGPLVELFEQRLAQYLGADNVVAVSSCTAGLHLALVALDVGPGDEVVTTPFTFVATVNAILHSGATPVFVDIERDTLSLAAERVAEAITARTKVIMPVHFGGRPLNLPAYRHLADERGVWIVEDAAHAIGAVAAGERVGASGHARSLSVFSFYPNKNLASAEGGAISVPDRDLADRLRRLRLHGLDVDAWKRYRDPGYRPSLALEVGFKYNWTDLQAAIALGQLEKLEGLLAVREHLADRLDELLRGSTHLRVVDRGPSDLWWRHALHLYQVAIEREPHNRDRFVQSLQARGIGAAVHYIAVNHHPAYQSSTRYPASEWASAALVTLPLHPHLSELDLERVSSVVERALQDTR